MGAEERVAPVRDADAAGVGREWAAAATLAGSAHAGDTVGGPACMETLEGLGSARDVTGAAAALGVLVGAEDTAGGPACMEMLERLVSARDVTGAAATLEGLMGAEDTAGRLACTEASVFFCLLRAGSGSLGSARDGAASMSAGLVGAEDTAGVSACVFSYVKVSGGALFWCQDQ